MRNRLFERSRKADQAGPTAQVEEEGMRRPYAGAGRQSKLSHSSLILISTAVIFLSVCLWSAAAYGAEYEHACPAPSANHATCYALLDKTEEGVKTYTAGSGELGGFDPSDLRSAYKLPSTGGSGQTVAIVDAYNDPNAESDLAAYRSHYGLSECSKTGGCFKKVNQKGEEGSYPENSRGWTEEMSLDLDMVSAACSSCHILLVEANNSTVKELAAAVNEAATLGATEISNSYGLPEEYESEHKGYSSYNSDYTHAGIPIAVSAGDAGYDNWEEGAKTPSFPATVPDVIAVGGTTLLPSEGGGREWAETVWTGSGGGCSSTQSKPSWQKFYTGCEHRMGNDVAAVADPGTPVSVYDTYELAEKWHDFGGTSVASPFIAGVDALSTSYSRSLEGADAFYLDASSMFDIKKGTNFPKEEGCTPTSLCNAEVGYDGPSGNGTPDGVLATWSVQEPPIPTEAKGARLRQGMSCTSSTACTAVGLLINSSGKEVPLAERWNGTTWTVQEPPSPTGATFAELYGVSCTSSTACIAVGSFRNSASKRVPLAEKWSGITWTVQEPPSPTGSTFNELTGVSCTSSTACTAVGYFINSSSKRVPLAERWNGTTWTVQEPPSPISASGEVGLDGVSCTSSTECVAVGYFISEKGSLEKGVPLAESWNGTAWTVQEPPLPTGEKGAGLRGVSCTSSTACTAVGWTLNKKIPLVESWNGTTWTTQEPPIPTGAKNSLLESVSCTSSTACMAVGEFGNSSGKEVPLAESWSGTTWTAEEPPSPTGEESSEMHGVSCTSSTACMAAGTSRNSSGKEVPVAEQYH